MTTQGLHCEAVPGSPGDPPSLSPSPQHSLSSVLCFPSLHSLLDAVGGGGGQVGSLPAGQPVPSACSWNPGFVWEWSRLMSFSHSDVTPCQGDWCRHSVWPDPG